MQVLVVVLNYRTPTLVVRCLESLQGEVERVGSMHVVVTDNASGDGSPDIIAKAVADNQWDWCTVIPLENNGGYSVGNNAGIRPYLYGEDPPEFVMLVNPDTYVREGAVTNLLHFMSARPDVGVAGSRLEDPDGTLQNGAFRFPGPMTELIDGFRLGILTKALKSHDLRYELGPEPVEVDWVVGAAMMIRAEVFHDVGLLDEGYFLYFDEVDFCVRVSRAGWKIFYVPDSVVVHLVGRSTGISERRSKPPRYPQYWFDSRRRFYLKNHGSLRLMAADLAFLLGYSTYRIRMKIQGKPDMDPPHFWQDFTRNSVLVRGFRP